LFGIWVTAKMAEGAVNGANDMNGHMKTPAPRESFKEYCSSHKIHIAELRQHYFSTHAVGHAGKSKLQRYDLRRLVQWGGIFSMFCRGSVFMMDVTCLKMLLQQVFLVGLCALCTVYADSSPDREAWYHMAKQVNQLVPFILGLYVALSLTRWWALRERALGTMFSAMSDVCMLMAMWRPEERWKPLHEELARFGLASVQLVVKAARHNENMSDLVANDLLTEDEVVLLQDLQPFQRAAALWSWILGLCRFGFHGMPPPNFNLLQQRCIEAREGIQVIHTYLRTQLPFAYVHLVAWLVHLQNIVVAVKAGLEIGCEFRPDGQQKLEKLFQEMFSAVVVCMIYQGLLCISYLIEDPFGDDFIDFPIMSLTNYVADSVHTVQKAQHDFPARESLERCLQCVKDRQKTG